MGFWLFIYSFNLQVLYWIESSVGKLLRKIEEISS